MKLINNLKRIFSATKNILTYLLKQVGIFTGNTINASAKIILGIISFLFVFAYLLIESIIMITEQEVHA